jgi:hypothetical protein
MDLLVHALDEAKDLLDASTQATATTTLFEITTGDHARSRQEAGLGGSDESAECAANALASDGTRACGARFDSVKSGLLSANAGERLGGATSASLRGALLETGLEAVLAANKVLAFLLSGLSHLSNGRLRLRNASGDLVGGLKLAQPPLSLALLVGC